MALMNQNEQLGYSNDFIANVAIRNKELRDEVWYDSFWSRFTGNVDVNNKSGTDFSLSGNPIERYNGFKGAGRDNMLIPFGRALIDAGTVGDEVLEDSGEPMTEYWLRAYINQDRKAVFSKFGNMASLRTKILDLYDRAKPKLVEWWHKKNPQEIARTFYEGASSNLSLGTDNDGLGLKKRYHPNWYRWDGGNDGDGIVTIGTEDRNKTANGTDGELDDAVGDLAGDGTDNLSAATLQALENKMLERRIPKIATKDGQKFWLLIVHPKQMTDLQGDSDYINAQKSAYTSKMLQSPLLSGVEGFYCGFAIFKDIMSIRAYDDTNTGFFSLGTGDETFARLTAPTGLSESNYNAIVVGQSAIGHGLEEDITFSSMEKDHGARVEVGSAMIHGYNRVDICTESNASTIFDVNNGSGSILGANDMENTSSLILMTE